MSGGASSSLDATDREVEPLLKKSTSRHSSRSAASRQSGRSGKHRQSDESTPLLSGGAGDGERDDEPQNGYLPSPASSRPRSAGDGRRTSYKTRIRWPTIVSLIVLCLAVIVILCVGFAAPAAIEEYAKEAAVFKPTALSIDSFTASGVRARIRGDFMMDGSRVERKPVRDLGRAGTWIAGAVETGETNVTVFVPEYGNILLGSALIPPVVVSVRDGETTELDFLADLEPGDGDGLRQMAHDWLDGRLGSFSVHAMADVRLKSGIFPLGTQSISETLFFQGAWPLFPPPPQPKILRRHD
jgi:hypothetical protein